MTSLGSVHYLNGNEFYLARDFENALREYSIALTDITNPIELSIKLYLNKSQCSLQLRRYEDVVIETSTVLSMESGNAKALYRRMSAYEVNYRDMNLC